MKIRAFDIKWDTDGQQVELPSEVQFNNLPDDFNPDAEIADHLSDEYGWCVKSVDFEIVFQAENGAK